MTETTVTATIPSAETRWAEINRAYLDLELRRLRLLLQRRVLWLRALWKHDPLQGYKPMVISEVEADALLAGEDRHAESHFYEENPEVAAITESIAQVEQELERQRQSWSDARGMPPLDTLVRLFGLTSFERETLLLCLALELDPAFERLYAYVQDEVARKYATAHLALTLFAGERSHTLAETPSSLQRDPRNSFLPEAPLRGFRIVYIDRPSAPASAALARPLRMDERVVDFLRGMNRLDERVADLLKPLPPSPVAPSHQELIDRLVRSREWRASGAPWTPLNLVGPRGAGKRAIARALCEKLGLGLYQLDVKRLLAQPLDRHEALRLLEREMILLQSALYIEVSNKEEAAAREAISDLANRLRAFFFVASRDPWQGERETVGVPVAKPDAAARRMLWERALADVPHNLNGHIEGLVAQFDLSPAAITHAVAAAQSRAALRDSTDISEITGGDLWDACRNVAQNDLEDLALRIVPCYAWEDIVLPEDVFKQLQEIASQVAHRYQVYERWGFGRRLSRGRGVSALFAGPSGTGKTMAAEVLANHLKLDLFRIDLAGVVSKYIGETEKNLRRVFDAAEQSGAILFFDEADALFGKRTEVKDSHDRYANIEVNYLLQRMDDYRGLAILATNRKTALDRAFLRRLRFLVDFPSPDANSRRRIWQKVFPSEAAVESLDFDAMARLEIPGGNVRNIAINAAFIAAAEGAAISTMHIMQAARREYAKIDKLITPSEFRPYYELVK